VLGRPATPIVSEALAAGVGVKCRILLMWCNPLGRAWVTPFVHTAEEFPARVKIIALEFYE